MMVKTFGETAESRGFFEEKSEASPNKVKLITNLRGWLCIKTEEHKDLWDFRQSESQQNKKQLKFFENRGLFYMQAFGGDLAKSGVLKNLC